MRSLLPSLSGRALCQARPSRACVRPQRTLRIRPVPENRGGVERGLEEYMEKLMPIRYVGSFLRRTQLLLICLPLRRARRRLRKSRLYTLLPFPSYGSDGVSWTRRFCPGVAHVLVEGLLLICLPLR